METICAARATRWVPAEPAGPSQPVATILPAGRAPDRMLLHGRGGSRRRGSCGRPLASALPVQEESRPVIASTRPTRAAGETHSCHGQAVGEVRYARKSSTSVVAAV